jgi:hypothetical protein
VADLALRRQVIGRDDDLDIWKRQSKFVEYIIVAFAEGHSVNMVRFEVPIHQKLGEQRLTEQVHPEVRCLGLDNDYMLPRQIDITSFSNEVLIIGQNQTIEQSICDVLVLVVTANSSTSVPPICDQYQRVIGVSSLLIRGTLGTYAMKRVLLACIVPRER